MSESVANADRSDWPLGRSRTTQLVSQLVKCSGGQIGTDELNDAISTVGELYTAASILDLWESGALEFGWDAEDEQLVLIDTNREATAGQGAERIIFRNQE